MTTVSGEITTLLDVLGHRKGDSRVLDAIVLVGPAMEVSEYDFDGEKSTYYVFKPADTELLFEDDLLVSVMVRTQADPEDETYGQYPRAAEVVEGLSPTATRDEVMAFLGDPERTSPSFDRYQVNNRYLHFEFGSNGRVAWVSALLEPV